MLDAKITYLFPDNPLPPAPSASFVRWYQQRERENVDYEWRLNMRRMYPHRLPLEVPYWYPRAKTMRYAYGAHPPVVDTVADVRSKLDSRYRRLGLVAAAARTEATGQLANAA